MIIGDCPRGSPLFYKKVRILWIFVLSSRGIPAVSAMKKLMWRRQNESSDFIADVLCRTGTGQQGMSFTRLMENAGSACARAVRERFASLEQSRGLICVLCGKGKNGGDGFSYRTQARTRRLQCCRCRGVRRAYRRGLYTHARKRRSKQGSSRVLLGRGKR